MCALLGFVTGFSTLSKAITWFLRSKCIHLLCYFSLLYSLRLKYKGEWISSLRSRHPLTGVKDAPRKPSVDAVTQWTQLRAFLCWDFYQWWVLLLPFPSIYSSQTSSLFSMGRNLALFKGAGIGWMGVIVFLIIFLLFWNK